MKKKVLVVLISVLMVGILVISLNSGSLFGIDEIKQGHKLYDKDGVMNGCQSPGSDCEYTVAKPPVG